MGSNTDLVRLSFSPLPGAVPAATGFQAGERAMMRRSSKATQPTAKPTDQQLLEWLRGKVCGQDEDDNSEDGLYGASLLARFGTLIESHQALWRGLQTIEDAHKLALAQMQFAQGVVHTLQREFERPERIDDRYRQPTAAADDDIPF
jgi:hypothetical protein